MTLITHDIRDLCFSNNSNKCEKARGRFTHSNTPFLSPRKAVLLLDANLLLGEDKTDKRYITVVTIKKSVHLFPYKDHITY